MSPRCPSRTKADCGNEVATTVTQTAARQALLQPTRCASSESVSAARRLGGLAATANLQNNAVRRVLPPPTQKSTPRVLRSQPLVLGQNLKQGVD